MSTKAFEPLSIRRRAHSIEHVDRLCATGMAPLLARVLAARGIEDPTEICHELAGMPDWRSMKGLPEAANLLAEAICEHRRIVVLSDYDADGATGCAVAVRGLRMLGAVVDFVVPLRLEHGYGLTPDIVPQILEACPDIVMTVDNGISSTEGVAMLRDAGVQVVVTDHHLPPRELPRANVIVNPNQLGCPFPSKAIAGVGVAFYVVCAVRTLLTERSVLVGRPNLGSLLPIVALGTVADVVPLDHLNRIFVENGLRMIREGRAQTGVLALIEASRRQSEDITCADLAFYLGPRLNAAGRLADMRQGVRCLVTDRSDEAMGIARELDQLNEARRGIQKDTEDAALGDIGEPTHRCVCVAGDWHAGVVGVVAGKIKELFRRPAFVFSARDESGMMKGSGRSVRGYHLRDALARIEAAHPGLITKFGGHAMAAGMSLPAQCFEAFAAAFAADADEFVPEESMAAVVESDGSAEDALDVGTAEALTRMVWGQGFPEPIFDGDFEILSSRLIGADQSHLKLELQPLGQKKRVEAIWFGGAGFKAENLARFAYRLSVNQWKSRKSLQLMIVGAAA